MNSDSTRFGARRVVSRGGAVALALAFGCAESSRDVDEQGDGAGVSRRDTTAASTDGAEQGGEGTATAEGVTAATQAADGGAETGADTGAEEGGVPRLDVAEVRDLPTAGPMCAEEDPVPGEDCECGSLSFSIDTEQSCAIRILPGYNVDADGFINIGGTDYRVFAMDRWGRGRTIAWCDITTMPDLLQAFDVRGYLGGVANPRVASFGNVNCSDGGFLSGFPSDITYLGKDLPMMYRGNAQQLAADWDVIMACATYFPRDGDWVYNFAPELEEFVATHGRGLLVGAEYGYVSSAQGLMDVQEILAPAGIEIQRFDLEWSPSSTDVEVACVPGVPPAG